MNAYFIHAGYVNVIAEYIGGFPRYEEEFICAIVFANSRGRAKSLFFKKFEEDIGEYTSIKSVRLIARYLECEEGFADSGDPLWDQCPEGVLPWLDNDLISQNNQ